MSGPLLTHLDPRRGSRERAVQVAVAVVAALAAHGLSLSAGFAWDDRHTVVGNPALESLAGLLRSFTMDDWEGYGLQARGLYRPLATTSLFVDRWLFGATAAGFHATSLALHAWIAFAIARIARAWNVRPIIALAACALFAVHPVFSEAVDWVSARPDLLSTALFAGAVLAAPTHPLVAGFVAGLAPFAKEPGLVAVPATMIMLLLSPGSRRRAWAGAGIACVLATSYLAARHFAGVPGPPAAIATDIAGWPEWFRRWGDTGAGLVSAVAWPLPLDVTRRTRHLGSGGWVFGLLFAGAAIWVASVHGARRPLRAALAAAVVMPTAMIALYDAGLSERYLYLPGAGLALAAALVFEHAASRSTLSVLARRVVCVVPAVLVLAAVPASANRALQWGEPLALFADAVAADPENPRAYQMLGTELYRAGRRDDAVRAWETAVAHGAGAEVLSNLCAAHREVGQVVRAVQECDAAVMLAPGDPRARYHRALAHLADGRSGEAIEDLEAVVANTPGYAPAQQLLARLRASERCAPAPAE